MSDAAPSADDDLLSRALEELEVSVCIADARLPDRPLVYVNGAFERMTGWRSGEVLGRNCRFLQEGLPPQPEVLQLRAALDAAEPVQVVLRNRRRDGTPFANRLSITPLHDDDGVLTHFLALQRDVTAEVETAASLAAVSQENVQMAQDLQASLVPPQLPDAPGLDVAVRYTAAGPDWADTPVSGDFYDLYATASDVGGAPTWNAAIGDVTGRGAGAAAYTATVRNLLKGLALRPGSPAEALGLLNEALLDQLGDRFVTVALAQLQVRRSRVSATLALAGHPQPLVVVDGAASFVGEPGDLLGVLPGAAATDERVQLHDGDALVLYTDGITEAGPADDQFGPERLQQAASGLGPQATARDIADAVIEAVDAHEPHRDDDAALLVVRADLREAP